MARRGLLILLVVKLALGGLLILPKSVYAQPAGTTYNASSSWNFEDISEQVITNNSSAGLKLKFETVGVTGAARPLMTNLRAIGFGVVTSQARGYRYIGYQNTSGFQRVSSSIFIFLDVSESRRNRIIGLGQQVNASEENPNNAFILNIGPTQPLDEPFRYRYISSRTSSFNSYFQQLGDSLNLNNRPLELPATLPIVRPATQARVAPELLEVCKDYVLTRPFGNTRPPELQKQLELLSATQLVSAASDRKLYNDFYAQNSGDQRLFQHNIQDTPNNQEFQRLDEEYSRLVTQRVQQLGSDKAAFLAGAALLFIPLFKGVKVAQPLARAGLVPRARTFKTVAWQPTANFARSRWPAYKRILQASGASVGLEAAEGIEVDNNLQLRGVPTMTEIVQDFVKFPFYENIMNGFKNVLAENDREILAKMLYARTYLGYHLALHQCLAGAAEDNEALPAALKFDQPTLDKEIRNYEAMNRAVEQALGIFGEATGEFGKGDCPIKLPAGLGNAVCAMANFVLGLSITFTRFSFDLLLQATTLQ